MTWPRSAYLTRSIVELRMLVARRRDLQSDRVRAVNRLHETLLTISPALEKALDLTNQGPLILLTGYQTPAAIRQLGVTELTRMAAGSQSPSCRRARHSSRCRG